MPTFKKIRSKNSDNKSSAELRTRTFCTFLVRATYLADTYPAVILDKIV
jgi:hypothetical protein